MLRPWRPYVGARAGRSAFVTTHNKEGRIVSVVTAMYVMAMAMGYGYGDCDGYCIWPCQWFCLAVSADVVVRTTPAPLKTYSVNRHIHRIALCHGMVIL